MQQVAATEPSISSQTSAAHIRLFSSPRRETQRVKWLPQCHTAISYRPWGPDSDLPSPLALCAHHAQPNGASAIGDGSGPAFCDSPPLPSRAKLHPTSASPSTCTNCSTACWSGRCSSPGSAASQKPRPVPGLELCLPPAAGRWWRRQQVADVGQEQGQHPAAPAAAQPGSGAWRAQDCARAVGVAVETEEAPGDLVRPPACLTLPGGTRCLEAGSLFRTVQLSWLH